MYKCLIAPNASEFPVHQPENIHLVMTSVLEGQTTVTFEEDDIILHITGSFAFVY